MPQGATETRTPFLDVDELVRRRWRAGLNQSELADLASISKGQLSKIESGKSDTSPETLARLAAALGCTAADLERRPA